MQTYTKYLLFLMSVLSGSFCFSQTSHIGVSDNQTAQELIEILTGEGVTVLNPVLTCPDIANGAFQLESGTTNLGIDSGIVLTSGRAKTIPGTFNQGVNGSNNGGAGPDQSNQAPGDADLNTILPGYSTTDACVLEFDFLPAGDSISFEYVFASTEYQIFSCTQYNDVFGFFITGPTFTTPYNMAKIPGTEIPITVNSTTGWGTGSMCTDMGPGSPFSQYFVDNIGGETITYGGFTTVFTASAIVNPCDTYHLKLAIADASTSGSDHALDSGVFLKAGSLTSTAIDVETFGGGGLEFPFTNTVRGCPPGIVRISRGSNFDVDVTIPLMFGGTALNGIDYEAIPNSVVIQAGDTSVDILVEGIPMDPPVGEKSVIISALSPYTCGSGEPIILGADTIMIYDSLGVSILNPDTAICLGESVYIEVEGSDALTYTWTPDNGTIEFDPNNNNVTVTPTEPTTYTVSVELGDLPSCHPTSAQVFVDVKVTPEIDLGPDLVTCEGGEVQLNAATSPLNPDETFSWTPVTSLSDPDIRNPIASPASNTTYTVVVNPGAIGCDAVDSVNVNILPDHITLLNADTVVCEGTALELRVNGSDYFSYNWDPEQGILEPTSKNTILIARESGYYTVTASFESCQEMPDSFYVEVQPNPIVDVGPDRIICSYDTIQMFAAVTPNNYGQYTYEWNTGEGLSDSTAKNPIFENGETGNYRVIVTTPIGCEGRDSMNIQVNPGDFMTVTPLDTAVCPPANVQLNATGAKSYTWSPSWGLNDANIANPVAQPETTTEYVVIGKSIHECFDTLSVFFAVHPNAAIDIPDSVTIWPGERYQINPGGNALYYSWFPSSGLNADDISNPVAQPDVRTRYYVTATTEEGCIIKDSIDILVNTESVLDAPNAFTPGSGVNGTFKIEKRGFAELTYFRIFNRWGNKVFETSNIEEGWDGTFNGKPQPLGVYIYSIEAETANGKVYRKDGNLTLIR